MVKLGQEESSMSSSERGSELIGSVSEHEALETQAADLLHLLDAARPLRRALAPAALGQLP